MELRLSICVVILALMVDGGRAQLDVCGLAPFNTWIVGGAESEAGAWPWQASLHTKGSHHCGGTLINDIWILTSVSCFRTSSPSDVTVYLGRQTQEGATPFEVSRSVAEIIRHPNYDLDALENDIALLKLSDPVKFTDYIRPVCLAAAGSDFIAGSSAWVTGWGRVNTGAPLPTTQRLQEVKLPLVSNKECNDHYVRAVTDNMMCAGDGGKGTCFGDSGGPLVIKPGKRWIQAGVVSWGDAACTVPIRPGVYTKVSNYQSWIEKYITTNQPGFVHSSE